ncbi:MAG: penicillin acylase family protein [Kiloniellales bacterium]
MTPRRIAVWVARTLVGFLLVVLVLGGAGYYWLRGSVAPLEGEARIAALSAAVEVLRDDDGVATIRAESESDALIALGYVHAQDRLWQMDFTRRIGAGRLSEVVGEATIRTDQLMRTLGLYRVAEANLEHLTPQTRAALDAYAAGVNAFIEGHEGPWPPEFYLLRYRPEPWRPADSLVWGRLMALQLSGNWSDEVRRLRLAGRLTPEQIAFLWPSYPGDAPVAIAGLAARYDGPAPLRLGELLPWDWAPKDASNAWVLAGSKTASGKPILANDPHLGLTAPGLWYLVRIETPELTLAGASAPGVPFVLVGHNGDVAWGQTTTHGDTQDLFIEQIAPDTADSYVTPEGPRRFTTRRETILVRGEEPVELTVRETHHGPVISDVYAGAEALVDGHHVLALAWPALRPDDRTGDALFHLVRARDWSEFEAALETWHSPLSTMVFADRAGTIALIAAGRVPLRKSGDGRAPVPGWTSQHDWEGFVPYAGLPRLVDPPLGRIVTANNRLVPDDYPYLISADWSYPQRARRIEELLDAGPRPAVEDHMAMQQDILSNGARRLLPIMLRVLPDSEATQEARALLEAWDFRMDRTRPEPLLFAAWVYEAKRLLIGDELGDSFADFQRYDPVLLERVLSDGQAWCDDVTTPTPEDCPTQIGAALESALAQLKGTFGSSMADWRWGEAHRARFPHQLLSRVPLLGALFDFGVQADGGSDTVNRGGMRFAGAPDERFEDVHGPGFRAVFDLADLDNSRFMVATGQSGNPLSPLYGNLAEAWRDGRYKRLGHDDAGSWRLRLAP